MQDVHTASSSCNSIFAFTALRPRLAPAPEGRWYRNEPVVLMDLWDPGSGSSFTTQPTQLRRDSDKPSRFWRIETGTPLAPQGVDHGCEQVHGLALP
jgi:hypothetical protein